MKQTTTKNTLISLAMLNAKINCGEDYIEYFKPFVLSIVINLNNEYNTINEVVVSEKLKKIIGLKIPIGIIHILLKRLVKDKILLKANGTFTVDKSKISTLPNLEEDKIVVERHIDALIADFIKFYEVEMKKTIITAEALEYFIQFLELFSIESIRLSLKGTLFNVKSKRKNIFIVSKYILTINKENPERFDDFLILLQGNMIANSIIDEKIIDVPQTYKNVVFFIDTPLFISLYGLDGDIKENAAIEMFNIVKNLGGKFAVFEHTLKEIVNLISTMANQINNPDEISNNILRVARKNKLAKADLVLKKEQIDVFLKNMEISLERTPDYKEIVKIDESELEKKLDEEINYYNSSTKRKDIKSIQSIYVLREECVCTSIEKAKAVLVTSNQKLAQVVAEFAKNELKTGDISPVITDFSLANISWLKSPQGASTLPKKSLLSVAYASMMPSKKLLTKFLDEIEKLHKNNSITENDYILLRSSYNIDDDLMLLTGGEDSALKEETICDLLERTTAEIREKENAKYKIEQEEHEKMREQLKNQQEYNDKLKYSLFWECVTYSKIIKNVFVVLLSIIGTVSGILIFVDIPCLAIVGKLISSLSLLSLITGFTVIKWLSKVELFFLHRALTCYEKKYDINFEISNNFSAFISEKKNNK